LFLEYQPQVELATQRVVGLEALLRWRNREEVIYPDIFLPIAEESGLIADIDEWVIGDVCRQIHEWNRANLAPVPVAINISARHFVRPNLLARLSEKVNGAHIEPHRLCLEIPEDVLVDVDSARRLVGNLREDGFRVSIDNFGSDHASQAYLRSCPVDEVKIDPGFVSGVASNHDDRAFTRAIINMAQELNLHTVAKGVETEPQWQALKELRCDAGQGNLFSEPLSPSRLEKWLAQETGVSQVKVR